MQLTLCNRGVWMYTVYSAGGGGMCVCVWGGQADDEGGVTQHMENT